MTLSVETTAVDVTREQYLEEFHHIVRGCPLSAIAAMDETSVPMSLQAANYEVRHCYQPTLTVALTGFADGSKGRVFAIRNSRRENPASGVLVPEGMFLSATPTGFMTQAAMLVWLSKSWAHRPVSQCELRTPAILVLDSYYPHTKQQVCYPPRSHSANLMMTTLPPLL
eukprot:GHVU01107386.1.p1 GENE.GHVU01107386.1~~GHVU01107386.1.p1  ORF type:complete len:169 (+),score=3.81 GHVU01107386.1:189-695(+)